MPPGIQRIKERKFVMQTQTAGAISPLKVYLYNPRLWVLVIFLASMLEYTTRCGDALR
jgi:hypothetical protein